MINGLQFNIPLIVPSTTAVKQFFGDLCTNKTFNTALKIAGIALLAIVLVKLVNQATQYFKGRNVNTQGPVAPNPPPHNPPQPNPPLTLATMTGAQITQLSMDQLKVEIDNVYKTNPDRFNILLAALDKAHRSEIHAKFFVDALVQMLDVSGKMDMYEVPAADQQDLLFTLPNDVFQNCIFPYLRMNDIAHLRRACSKGRRLTSKISVEKNIPGKLVNLYAVLKSYDKPHLLSRRISSQQALILYQKIPERHELHDFYLPYPRDRDELIRRIETALQVDRNMENYPSYQSIQRILGYYRVTKGLEAAQTEEAKLGILEQEWGAQKWRGSVWSLMRACYFYIQPNEIPIFIKYWLTIRKEDHLDNIFIFFFIEHLFSRGNLDSKLLICNTIAHIYLTDSKSVKIWTAKCLKWMRYENEHWPIINTLYETMPEQLAEEKKEAIREFLTPFIEVSKESSS